jgi:long-subunit acyl-CoA synthetase (AMP-forming)
LYGEENSAKWIAPKKKTRKGKRSSWKEKFVKKEGVIEMLSWKQAIDYGLGIDDDLVMLRVRNQTPGQCINLVYTSGTTGDAKAVMLSHDNMTWFWTL